MSAEKMCPTCGVEYPANERFCPRDGTALRTQGGSSSDLVGSIIAERYHVIKKLGEGGMGQVYLAEHVKMGRKSAVKVMNPGMMHDADAISRFNREASNASRINHPSVAGIYDFGETSEGLIYLAMEFIEGEALTDVVKANGALAPRRAADITRQAAEGLAVAHEMGIVHRDLKPDNIMIARNRDGSDCVKVVDFGIAKAQGSENQKVTRTGMVVGTPEYMSPEQLSGDKLDGRSDIYSLALVTFNMLTGKLPFPSETAQESMIMRLTDKPKPLVEMNPGVAWPPAVQAVMDKALERDAKLRYQTASEFGNALWNAVDDMPKVVRTVGGAVDTSAQTMALPATRIGATPVAASVSATPPVAAKGRMPILIGGGVLAAAAVGAFFVFGQGSGRATPTPVSGSVVAPAVTPAADSLSAAKPGATESGRQVVPTSTQAEVKKPAVAAVAANKPAEPTIAERLPQLLDESSTEGGAAAALATANSLLPRATRTSDLVGLNLVKANALGMLSKDAESCLVLHSIQGSAGDTPYGARVALLLKSGC